MGINVLDILEDVLASAPGDTKHLTSFIDLGELLDDLGSGDVTPEELGRELVPLLPKLSLAFKALGPALQFVRSLVPKPDPEKKAARQAARAERKTERKAKRAARRAARE